MRRILPLVVGFILFYILSLRECEIPPRFGGFAIPRFFFSTDLEVLSLSLDVVLSAETPAVVLIDFPFERSNVFYLVIPPRRPDMCRLSKCICRRYLYLISSDLRKPSIPLKSCPAHPYGIGSLRRPNFRAAALRYQVQNDSEFISGTWLKEGVSYPFVRPRMSSRTNKAAILYDSALIRMFVTKTVTLPANAQLQDPQT